MKTKKYRVNESELFNLQSMRDKLYVQRDDAIDASDYETAEKAQARIEEVETLLNEAPYVGAAVIWPTLKRIREIAAERQMLRYNTCIAAGASESEAALAFTL